MKKIFIFLLICLGIVAGVLYFTVNPDAISNLAYSISNVFETPYDEYNEEFKINEIKISENSYYYNKLTEQQKNIYTAIANGVKSLTNDVKLKKYEYIDSETTMKDVEVALHKFLLDHPEVYYMDDKYTVSTKTGITGTGVIVGLTYQFGSIEELNNSVARLNSKFDEILNEATIEKGKDFENEQKIHDVLSKKVTYYEYEDLSKIPSKYHTIEGTLTENLAVCDGLAKTFQILLDKVGIKSIIVSGSLNGTSHAWNMVQLEDGWYHTDITSDNSIKTEKKVVFHSYFNINTETIKKTHVISEEDIIPESTSTKYNFYEYTGKNIVSGDNFANKLKEIISKNSDENLVEYKVNGFDNVPEKTIDVLRKNKFTDYLETKSTKFIYYNVLDTYIVLKK